MHNSYYLNSLLLIDSGSPFINLLAASGVALYSFFSSQKHLRARYKLLLECIVVKMRRGDIICKWSRCCLITLGNWFEMTWCVRKRIRVIYLINNELDSPIRLQQTLMGLHLCFKLCFFILNTSKIVFFFWMKKKELTIREIRVVRIGVVLFNQSCNLPCLKRAISKCCFSILKKIVDALFLIWLLALIFDVSKTCVKNCALKYVP